MPDPTSGPGPRWTVDDQPPEAQYADLSWGDHKLWRDAHDVLPVWLAYDAWAALVAAVRASEQAPRLRAAIAAEADRYRAMHGMTFPASAVAVILDGLLTGETDD